LQYKIEDGFLFTWCEVLLASGLLFFRALAVCAIVESRERYVVIVH